VLYLDTVGEGIAIPGGDVLFAEGAAEALGGALRALEVRLVGGAAWQLRDETKRRLQDGEGWREVIVDVLEKLK
jgi:hypothetical protein